MRMRAHAKTASRVQSEGAVRLCSLLWTSLQCLGCAGPESITAAASEKGNAGCSSGQQLMVTGPSTPMSRGCNFWDIRCQACHI